MHESQRIESIKELTLTHLGVNATHAIRSAVVLSVGDHRRTSREAALQVAQLRILAGETPPQACFLSTRLHMFFTCSMLEILL